MNRPLLSIEIRTQVLRSRLFQAKDVNCDPCSVFMNSGGSNVARASFSASTQKSASRVFEIGQASTSRVCQSIWRPDKKIFSHWQIRDVGTPDPIRLGLVYFRRFAGVWFLIERRQAQQPHQASNPFLVHQMNFVSHVPSHLPDAKERCFQNCSSIWRINIRFIDVSPFGM